VFTFLFTFLSLLSFGQSFDSLKLNEAEIPAGYSVSDKLLCATPYACSFYEQVSLYESFLSKVVRKEFQSFNKKGDRGSILYFEFDKDFNEQAFLNGLLWGQSAKPTKGKSDEYYVLGHFLIIWSFELTSDLKEVSKSKVIKQ
jgi:hypothetical protein